MDWNRVEGDWKRMKGKVKEQWGLLTDDDLTAIGGRKDQLEGKIQERYGYGKDQVRKEIESWFSSTALVANDNAEELADQIEAIRADIQSLTSTVSRVANKQLGQAQDKAVEAMSNAEDAIRENPVSAVAIAAGLGFLFGIFARR